MNLYNYIKKALGKRFYKSMSNKEINERVEQIESDIQHISLVPASQARKYLEIYKLRLICRKEGYQIRKYLPDYYAFKLNRIRKRYWRKRMFNEWMEAAEICTDNKLLLRDITLPAPAGAHDVFLFITTIRECLFSYLLEECILDHAIPPAISGYPYEHDTVRIENGDIVIDAGACIGEFSALASARGASKVYAFEPVAKNIMTYLSKTAQYNKNIEICDYALSDYTGKMNMNISDIPGVDDAASSVLDLKNDVESVVEAITIDEFASRNNISRIDFIKADIEGSERNMLRGAKKVLKEFGPKLAICAYHLPDDPDVLRELILDANPYYIIYRSKPTADSDCEKLFAYVAK